MVWGAIAGGLAAGAAAGMLGRSKGGKVDYGPAIQQIKSVDIPQVEELKVRLAELVQQGQLDPIEAQNILQEASQYEDIELDPYTRQAQMESLKQLRDIGTAEGLDPIAKAKLAEAESQFETTARGARGAATQHAQERGLGGSGLELANIMAANQEAATRASGGATQAAADANRRALEAIYASGELGGKIRGQEYGMEAEKASAQDVINRFNIMSRQGTQEANIGRRAEAERMNLAERQRLSDYNIQQQNLNRLRGADLQQQRFENEMQKANAMASLYGSQAQSQSQAADREQAMRASLLGIGGQMATAYAGRPNYPQQPQQQTAMATPQPVSARRYKDDPYGYNA